ncbi:MAG: sigma-70 family RNA polymerase sigma factor [Balneolaceae bacterium]
MDYSGLVDAIQQGDTKTANKMCAEATPILKKYLISNVGATPDDAEDAVQKMFEYVIPKIQQDEIESPTGLLAYMLTGSRHSYFKIVRDLEVEPLEELVEEPSREAGQIWNLIDKEQQSILQKCLKKLKDSYRAFVKFLFDFPDAEADDIAEHFGISVNNAWIRRHRVIKKLTDCTKNH